MTIELVSKGGERVKIAREVLDAFRADFRGVVLDAGGTGYDESRAIWNAMIDRRPGLILRCTGTQDVVRAVEFARRHSLLVSVRGGGHNIAGLAICEGGVVLDLSAMKGVWVDPKNKIARAQAGCTLGDVDRETQLHGLAAVLGFVSQTGIAGLTVGGGIGYLTRRFGWTCDTVVSMEVVMADGKVVRAAEDENEDLFWALRGGSGNFGIVTSFEYRLFPVGPQIYGGAIAWSAEHGNDVMRAYRELTETAPRELTAVATLRIAPPSPWLPKEIHGKPVVMVVICHTGSIEDGERLIAPLRATARPVADIVTPRPYAQLQAMLDPTQPKGRRYYWKSHYLPRIDPAVTEIALQSLAKIASPHSAILFFHFGGAIAELPEGHSAMGNRDAQFVFNIASAWEKGEDDERNIAWSREVFEATRKYSTGGVYVNFLTEEEGRDRIEAAYGKETLARLATLKRRFDPENFFCHAKSVA